VAKGKKEILSSFMVANGNDADLLKIPGGGSRTPSSPGSLEQGLHYLKMQGKETFKVAVKVMAEATLEALRLANLKMEDIALVIPHQANLRIIQAIGERMQIPAEKLVVNLDRVGNTSAASVIVALDECVRSGRLKEGDAIVLVAFGAGTTLASAVVKW
jgi:3-oxoacyl-[acyl-carrier-protein] synthase-3